jgi:hypothetical protein
MEREMKFFSEGGGASPVSPTILYPVNAVPVFIFFFNRSIAINIVTSRHIKYI